MYVIQVPEGEEREWGQEVTFEETIAKSCPKMMKDRESHRLKKSHQSPTGTNENYTWTGTWWNCWRPKENVWKAVVKDYEWGLDSRV